jgi:Lon protease-like protein
MSGDDVTQFDAASFSGRARLFPLPNLVVFPHAVQALHIFEQRYREMLEDAMADDQLLAMALLAPGWEANYEGRPAIHLVACLGRIVCRQGLPDGRSNIVLAGLRRVRVLRELDEECNFRRADVEVLADVYPPLSHAQRPALSARLLKLLHRRAPGLFQQLPSDVAQALPEMPLGMVCDLVAHRLNLEMCCKQRLLEEMDVDRRATLLLEQLGPAADPLLATTINQDFPPEFSVN